jgi:hypothetical protein
VSSCGGWRNASKRPTGSKAATTAKAITDSATAVDQRSGAGTATPRGVTATAPA